MPAATEDRVLRLLLVGLIPDTAFTVSLSASGVTQAGPSSVGRGLRLASGLTWFGLLTATLWRSGLRITSLRHLVSTRDDQMAAVAATCREWLWEAKVVPGAPPNLVVTSCSPGVRRALGLTPDDVLGRPLLEFVSEADLPRARAVVATALRQAIGTGNCRSRSARSRTTTGRPLRRATPPGSSAATGTST
ncbi:MAG TPA: PAS domain-containing protein [Acidimicrobiales bacterium]|nr:PAS domain-containing protein [Acidimicrobiales bacterium]